MKYKAVIFDMDGVLIDSMLHWMDVDVEFFKQFGIALTDEMIKYFSGRSGKENMTWLKEQYKLTHSVEVLLEKRDKEVEKIYSHLTKVLPGVRELINKIKKAKIKMAIASGAPFSSVNKVVQRFEWQDHFTHLISSEHVGHVGKPHPGIYLHTAKQMGVKPVECVVIEDAENGVVSAKAAGMACIAAIDKRWSFGNFSKADLVVKSLTDKKVFKFIGI